MKYLCMVYLDEKQDYSHFNGESLAYDRELERSGHFIAAQALQSTETATLVRVRNAKISVTDGPFAETKEQLGGFILIEARDLNDAIQVASKIPMARVATIEVRPILELTEPEADQHDS